MIVVAAGYGRLGNRLFTYGHLIASAHEHRYRLWNPAFGDYAHLFPATAGDPLCRFPRVRSRLPAGRAARSAASAAARVAAAAACRLPLALHVVEARGDEEVDVGIPELVERCRSGVVLARGWALRDHAAVAAHAAVVREHLRPQPEAARRAEALVAAARLGADALVGVHVRRGDYRAFRGGRYFYEPETYAHTLRALASLLGPRTRFLVCSDEPLELAALGGVDAIRATGRAIEDLHALSLCDRLVGPPSTFTAWASFVGSVPLLRLEDPDAEPALDRFEVVRS